jgi:MFS family permease
MMKTFRERFEFMNKNLRILTIRQTVGMFFRRMVMPYSSLFILAVGGDNSQVGIVNSLRPLAGLLIFPISGTLTDRTGRVKLIALAGYLTALTMLLYVFAPSWEWIALGALLQGFMVFQFPPSSAILADSIGPRNRGMGIATMGALSNTFAMFSPYIAAVILEISGNNIGMRILYGLLALSQIVNATLVLRYLEETAIVEKPDKKLDALAILKESYSGIPELVRTMPKSIKALGFLIGIGFISNAIAAPFWIVYITDVIGISKIDWGIILLVEAIFRIILTIPCGMIADRYSRTKTLFAAVFFSLFSLPTLVIARGVVDVLLIRLGIALAGALFMPSSTALMADYIPREQRGKVMAAIGRGSVMVGATGGGTGGPGMGYIFTIPVMTASILGGILYSVNPVYPWICVLGATILQLVSLILFIRDPEKAEE